MPVYMQQRYESEQNGRSDLAGDSVVLRRQEYWSALSGAAGQFYGNHYTWRFAEGWQEHLDTSGSAQFGYLAQLLDGLPWFRLVPDFGTASSPPATAGTTQRATSARATTSRPLRRRTESWRSRIFPPAER